MAEGTKERILRTALELFAQNGYLGTSMNDIAGQLGFTKAALYKHYASKQEILDKIVERMNKMDYERAEVYEMPETEPDGFAEAYLHTPIQKIRTAGGRYGLLRNKYRAFEIRDDQVSQTLVDGNLCSIAEFIRHCDEGSIITLHTMEGEPFLIGLSKMFVFCGDKAFLDRQLIPYLRSMGGESV